MPVLSILSKMRCPVCKAKNIKNKDPKTGLKRVQKFGKYYKNMEMILLTFLLA